MSAAFAVSLFPYYNNVFFSAVFLPVLFQQFLPAPYFFCLVSDSGVFLPALLAVLFFLFQKIFSFSFPAFCRTSFRNSCLHHPSALNRPVRPALQSLYRLSYFSLASSFFRKDLPVRNSVFQVFTIFVPCRHHHQPENRPVRVSVSAPRRFSCRPFAPSLFSVAFALFSVLNFRHFFLLCCEIADYFFLRFPFSLFFPSSLVVRKNYPVHNAFTWPLPSFLRFACIVRFSAKTFLSEIPSPRSLQSLSHANITINPKTDLSEYLSQLRVVFPANLLSKLYFLSLSRCFRFLVYKCSLISPFSSSLASFFFPCGLALAPLAFSLRLSVWKNFPFHIYINELTLSTLFRDKNDVPKLFLLLAWRIPSLPTCFLAIDRQKYFSAPLFFLCTEFLRPVLNLIFSILSKGVSPRYKALNSFPIIMRKRKFFSRRHKAKSLASKPP